MKIFFVAALLCLSFSSQAQHFLLKNESVIFSFDTQHGRHVVLAKDNANAYIVYRYGTGDSVEFEYPAEKNMSSWKKFKYSFFLRGGGASNEGVE